MTIEMLFLLGMKRYLGELKAPSGLVYDVGCGNNPVKGAKPLDYPEWDAEVDAFPEPDGSVGGIYAFHFLEHLDGKAAIRVLREFERVLVPGGLLTVVVPHRLGSMAFQDLDHKSFWTEDSWKTLFSNPNYDKNREAPWKFEVDFNAIIGINERNLALCSQLRRVE